MELEELSRNQWRAIFVSAFLIISWISVPLYLQLNHGLSAVQVSFAITVIYYLGFKLWKEIGSR